MIQLICAYGSMGHDDQELPDEIHDLSTPFTDEELHDAAQKLSSKGSTAPGPDGWSYQTWYKTWPMSGDFLVNLANHIFQHPDAMKEPHLSSIIIRLLPKDKFNPQSPDVNHLRPISLTNTSIRIILFAFTTRLLPCLTRIISTLQQAFLPNTSIHRIPHQHPNSTDSGQLH
ncbi:unnamed protein product [Ambrosiozyma monospora]|uniref:Unnamed protein product n=1 Tax=Ambrosiozyma monospora TaxID=43982 RepID=A0A9W6YXH5_AMBMO|nr:unnamed protein product [Ambrosiozyma monospora]